MPTTVRRCSLHTIATDLRPSVRAVPDFPGGEAIVIQLGGNALVLDVETANELAEALRLAVIEQDAAADAMSA